MSKQMIISVMSKDRPGIIANVTGAIFELKGDLADLKQSVLDGYFTMILIASFPENVTPEAVMEGLSRIESEVKIEVMVKLINTPKEEETGPVAEKTYVVTAQGKNRSGLVYGISSFCYKRNINIIDLTTALVDDQYTMILQIDLSETQDISALSDDLETFATESGLEVVLQHYDIFRATNEVTLL